MNNLQSKSYKKHDVRRTYFLVDEVEIMKTVSKFMIIYNFLNNFKILKTVLRLRKNFHFLYLQE